MNVRPPANASDCRALGSIGYAPAVTCSTCASRAPLCPACRAQRLSWSIGIARDRGVAWAARVRAETAPETPESFRASWPAWAASERVRRRARELVADLAISDAELADQLGEACAAAAARAYAAPPPAPGGVAFRAGG